MSGWSVLADRIHQQVEENHQRHLQDKDQQRSAKAQILMNTINNIDADPAAREAAWDEYAKLYPSPENKTLIEKAKEVMGHIVSHRDKAKAVATGQVNPAAAPPAQPTQPQPAPAAGQGQAAVPAKLQGPAAPGVGTTSSTGGQGGAGGPAPAPAGAPTSPPAAVPKKYTMGDFIQQSQPDPKKEADRKNAQAAEAYRQKAQIDIELNADDPKRVIDGLVKAGFTEEQAKSMYSKKYEGASGRPRLHAVQVQDPNDPTKKIPAVQDLDTKEVIGPDQAVIPNPVILQPGLLPNQTTTDSDYNADTGHTSSKKVTGKVLPGADKGAGAGGGTSKSTPVPSKLQPKTSSGGGTAAAGGTGGGRLAAMAKDWQESGIVPSAKDRPQVEAWMKANGQSAPVALTPAGQSVIMAASPVVDQIDKLIDDIDYLKLGDNNTMGYLLGSRLKYKAGMASDEGTLGEDLAGLSLGSVVEAAAALKGSSRSIFALRKALQHTPNPWVDSPKQIKHKLENIKARMQDVMEDAYKYGKKGTTPDPTKEYGSGKNTGGVTRPKSMSPPGGTLTPDQEAEQYINAH